MNVGFNEAMKADNFTCVIFHDVDLIPEDARNDYSCPSSPRHMSTAVSRHDYMLVFMTEGFLFSFEVFVVNSLIADPLQYPNKSDTTANQI